jgi:hypothetical protein
MKPLTRADPHWEDGAYQRWFSYSDDARKWAEYLSFMDLHGWIDESTTEVLTTMILYSPRADVFSVSDVKFRIAPVGVIKTSLDTSVVTLTDKRVREGHWQTTEPASGSEHRRLASELESISPSKMGGTWSLLPAWMLLWATLTILVLVWELSSVGPGPPGAFLKAALAFSIVNRLSMAPASVLYGRAWRLVALAGGLRPGQC